MSTPIAAVTGTTITVRGGGTLVNRQPARSTGGLITVNPISLAAGKQANATITVTNDGPSDATTTVTIPLDGRPQGVSIVSATVGGTPCTVTSTAITCTGVTVPGGGSTPITVRAAATTTTPPATVWNLTGLSATLNGTAISGQGRLLTVSDPDVNLDNGVSITPATAVPGGDPATTRVTVRNVGIIPATATTITLPAPPAGYTVGTVTTTGGGTCTADGTGVRCTGVTVPATGSVVVSVPVTLGAGVTAAWTAAAGSPVTASSGGSTGTATGTLVTANPTWTLGVTATGPADRTVRPGQTATMTVTVSDRGPSDARDASYVVVAPQGTTFGTLTGTAAACTQLSPTALRCTNDIPAAGPAVTLTLPLDVAPTADPAVPLTGGCVSLDNNTTCGDPGDAALPTINLRTPIADRLTAITTQATIVPGRDGTAQVRLTSTQDEDDLTVTIPLDDLPAGFTVTGDCARSATALTCTGVDLTAGRELVIPLTVAVAANVTPPATWTATGITVSDGGEDLTVTGALATAGTPAYALSATVGGPADNTIEPGQTADLSLTVRNAGPSDAPATVFRVLAPTGTTFGTPTGAAATACQVTPGSATATCTVTLTAGTSSPVLTLPVAIPAGADVNTPLGGGCVDLDNSGTCGPAPDVAFDPIMLKVPFAQQVAVTTTPVTVTPGTTGTATVNVQATHGDVSGLTVTVPLAGLPAGMTVSDAGACTVTGTAVTCTGVAVENGTTLPIRLTLAVAPGAAQGPTWTATGITVAQGAEQVTASGALGTIGAPQFTLAPTFTPPANGTLIPGGTGTLRVTVDNEGPSDAAGASVAVIAPLGTTLSNGPAGCTVAGDGRSATCPVTLTAAAAPVSYDFDLTVDAQADADDPVTGGCYDTDANGVCDPGEPRIPDFWLQTPLADIVTVTTTPATIAPGRTGTATVTLTSGRPQDDLDVTIPLAGLPAGFRVTGAPGCTVGAAAITCDDVDLTGDDPLAIELTVAVAASVAPGTAWTATGIDVTNGPEHVTADGALATAGPSQAAVTAVVTPPADGTVTAGDTTSLALVVSNAGPSDVSGRTFTVTAPADTTFGTLTGDAATACTVAGDARSLSCTVSLAAGTSTPSLALPLAVDPGADPFTPIAGGCVNLSGPATCDTQIPEFDLRVPLDRRARILTTSTTVTPGTQEPVTIGVQSQRGALSGLTLVIPLADVPASMTVTAVAPGCTQTPAEVRCTGIDVADGATTSVTALRVRAAAAATEGTAWTATGIVLDAGSGGQLTQDGQLAVVGAPAATLQATVDGPDEPILPGGTGTLDITLDNAGPSDLPTTTIGFDAPTGSTIGDLSAATDAICDTEPGATRLTCTFGLPADADPIVLAVPVVVDPDADPRQPLTGGCVDLDNDRTCSPPDVTVPPVPLATPFAQQIDIGTTPVTVTPGRTGVARITVTTDPEQTGLTVTVPLAGLPSGVTVGTPSVAPTGTCTSDATTIRCTGVDIAAGGAATVSVPLAVSSAAPAATWTATGITVTNGAGASRSADGVLLRTGAASFTLTGTTRAPAEDTVLPGGTADIDLVLDNQGPSDAVDAPVAVTAPVGTTFGPLTGATAQACTATTATTLSCRVNLAATSEPLVLTLPVVIPADADPAVRITGGCADLDGTGACGGTGDVVLPDLALRAPLATVVTVTSSNPSITPGTSGTATITVNSSPARPGSTVRLDTATLPAGLTLVSATPCTDCPNVDLPTTLTLRLTAAADAVAASWTPTVTVTNGPETATFTPVAARIGAPVHPLAVAVDAPAPGTVPPGGTAELAVTLTNEGPSFYPDARVQFKAPTGTTFAPPTGPAAGFCTATADLVTCADDLPAGDRAFTLALLVPGTADPGVPLDDGCWDADLDGVCGGAPDQPLPPVELQTPLGAAATLTVEAGTAVPGGAPATGTVVVTSTQDLTGLTLTVPTGTLPAGLTITAVAPSASCSLSGAIVCTGVDLTTGRNEVLTVTVRAASGAAGGIAWNPGTIVLRNTAGQQAYGSGTLITTGAPVAPIVYDAAIAAEGVTPGGTATLTVTVDNTGPSDATGATTSILAPADTTFGPLGGRAATDCTPAGDRRLDCRFDLTAAAAPLVWEIPVVVDADADPATTLGGGCVDTDGDGACAPTDEDLPGIPLTRTLDQAITVTADNPAIIPGRTGTATVTVRATDARSGLTVTVPLAGLPAGVTVTGARQGGTTDCVVGTTDVTCSGTTLAAAESTGIALAVSTTAAAAAGATWTPQVSVAQGSVSVVRPVTALTIGAAASTLTVTVTPPAAGTVLPGSDTSLAVAVANSGPSNARARVVTFRAPDSTTFIDPLPAFCTAADPRAATCTVDVDAADTLRFTLPIRVAAAAGGGTTLGNGCVDTGTGCDTDIPDLVLGTPLNDRVQVTTQSATVVPGQTAVAYVRTVADRAIPGATVTVPLTSLPAGLTVVSAAGPTGAVCGWTGEVRCTGVDVATGATNPVALLIRAASALRAGVTWTATGITLEAGGETATGSGRLAVTGTPDAPLTATVTGPTGTVLPGEVTSTQITVANPGPSDATGVTATVTAPSNSTFGALSGQVALDCTAAGPATLTCQFGQATGTSRTWTIPVLVDAGATNGDRVANGCITIAGSPAVCGGNATVASLAAGRTLQDSTTVAVTPATVTPGSSGTATLTYTSTASYDDLTLTIPLSGKPAGMTVTGAGTCVVGATAITCTGLALAAGTPLTVSLDVTLAGSATGRWDQTGITLAGDATAGTLVSSGTLITAGAPVAPIEYDTTVAAAGVTPGGEATLTVTADNTGPSDAVDATTSIIAPAGTTFGTLTGQAAADCTPAGDRRLDCTFDLTAAATPLVWEIPLLVSRDADPTTTLGGGCVDTNRDGTCGTGEEDLPGIPLTRTLDQAITVTADNPAIIPGRTGTATVTVRAADARSGLTVTVPLAGLPAGVTVTGASGTCVVGATAVTCPGITLAAGASTGIALAVTTTAAAVTGSAWAPSVGVRQGDDAVTRPVTALTVGTASSTVTATVTGPTGNVLPDDVTSTQITVTNTGPSDAAVVSATVTAPTNSTFGTLSGQVALDCNRVADTTLTCRFAQAAGTTRTWSIPVVVSSTATNGDPVANGCITISGSPAVCGGNATVTSFAADRPLTGSTTVAFTPATVAAGDSGTATIRYTSTASYDDLTLTVPLGGLPAGMTVTGATVGGADCTVGTSAITCTALSLAAGTPLTITVAVTLASTVATGTKWAPAGVLLAGDTTAGTLSSNGTLVTATAASYNVTVTVGTPTVAKPAPGQTTVLPITLTNSGPQDADPYVATIVLPTNTTVGTLPDGCAQGSTARTVVCTLAIANGETTTIELPLVVSTGASIGSTISGGCVDGGDDGTCGSSDDQALPTFTVGAPSVDLNIEYSNPQPRATKGTAILLKLPYSNNGTTSAADVSFVIDPPAGTTLTKAAVLLDASAADFTAQATADDTIPLSCQAAPDVDANAVTCTGPDAPVGASSELWLYLAVAKTAKAGTFPVDVTISTTSAEGNTVNNTATASLTIAGSTTDTDDPDTDTDSGSDGDTGTDTPAGSGSDGSTGSNNLPKTGQDLTGLILLAVLLVVGGAVARIGARTRRR
ncbi:beta strand repeat-containing protein [Actinoplanes sp. RD1]|uniref:beta strand repeat-containing protein n=1 Tax=Actinoplanes sp. RD1 TaxID=3064538 RepID=UPI002741B4A7|nr:hypothetical protein [Actinoplanes sp. RD1]